VEGIDPAELDCVYSPAKRRGPVPGKTSTRKAADMFALPQDFNSRQYHQANNGGIGGFRQQNSQATSAQFSAEELKQMLLLQQQLMLQQQQQQQAQQSLMALANGNVDANNFNNQGRQLDGRNQMVGGVNNGMSNVGNMNNMGNMNQEMVNVNNNLSIGSNGQMDQSTLELLQQYQNQMNVGSNHSSGMSAGFSTQENPPYMQQQSLPPNKRAYRASSEDDDDGIPKAVRKHLPLLGRLNRDGNLLRSYYDLSVNDILNLPAIPSDEEYCGRLLLNNKLNYTPDNLPIYDHSVLRAARFAELALGALANEQLPLALELSNCSVMCMRNCGDEPVDSSCMYEVARAYLLHGIFRSFRGDFVRYFKYRRVCMTHVGQLEDAQNVEALIAAVSFHDALAYMMHNASEDALPDIDQLPKLKCNSNNFDLTGEIESKYGISTNAKYVASEPYNQMWMQGAPPVFLNNEANLTNRTLDGLACAIRSCCDQANSQFEEMAKAAGADLGTGGSCGMTTTAKAVMANENELCSRNLVLSSRTLLENHKSLNNEKVKRHGLEMMAMAMDVFLENSGDPDGGFTDSQIKNLLNVSDIIVKNPLLLHAPGPVYHMMSNAAIMLCHLLNGMHATCGELANSEKRDIKEILFGEVLDAYVSMRKLLSAHRKALPVKLRCHGLPKLNVGPFRKSDQNAPFIDMGDTMLCTCRGCQGFVLMGCSPCVAAERLAASASNPSFANGPAKNEDYQEDQLERELRELGEFDMDDDALLNVLSRFVED